MSSESRPIFPEVLNKPVALSLDIKLSFVDDKGSVAMGWYADHMPVLLYTTDSDKIVAKCLPFNQAGVGSTVARALQSLMKAMITIIEDAIENNYLNELTEDVNRGVGRPADVYWEKFTDAAKRQARLKKKIKLPAVLRADGAVATPQVPDLKLLRNMRRQFIGAA